MTPQLPPDAGWQGDRRRGAALGRRDHPASDPHAPRKFFLRYLRLDAGGYDQGGTYWGHSEPLWWAVADDAVAQEPVEFFFRAPDRDEARRAVLRRHPGARFFR